MEALSKFSEDQLTRLDLGVIGKIRNGNNENLIISDKSKAIYLIAGKQFNDYLDKTNQSITPQSVKSFLNSNKWEASTFNLKRQALINLISNQKNISGNFLLITAIKEAIKSQVRRIKVNQAITREDYLTKDQIEILKSVTKPKIALIIEFLFKSGCRISEMINIKLTDIELNGKAKIKVIGKGSKQRDVYVNRELIEEINRIFNGMVYLFETRNGTQYNRINLSKTIRKVSKKAGLDIHPHTLRHSTAEHLKSKKASPEYVQKYLGHSSVAITIANYYHGKPGEEITELFD